MKIYKKGGHSKPHRNGYVLKDESILAVAGKAMDPQADHNIHHLAMLQHPS